MKILLVADGPSIHTIRWAKYFVECGDEVHIATVRPCEISGVSVHVLPTYGMGKAGYVFGVFAIRRLIASIQPDVVQGHYITSFGFMAALAGAKPLVVTAWGDDVLIHPQSSLLKRVIVRYAMRKAELVTTVALFMNGPVLSLGVPDKKVLSIPFGIDAERFHPSKGNKPEGKTVSLICTRNFDGIYDIQTLIQALAAVRDRGIDVTAKLVGDGPLREELKTLVKRLDLEDRVLFTGYVKHDILPQLLAESHIFVTPALSDGNNVSLTEAMACRCFPIGTDIPANSQWIRHGENGYLYPKSDAGALADAIENASDNRELIESAGLINRQIVEKYANWWTCAHQTREVLAAVAAGTDPVPVFLKYYA